MEKENQLIRRCRPPVEVPIIFPTFEWSQQQIDQGFPSKNIFYSVCSAEHTTFIENQFDLITVAQALHWFSLEEFLTSWSATQKYIRVHQVNPVDEFVKSLKNIWKGHSLKLVTFPLFMKLGRVRILGG